MALQQLSVGGAAQPVGSALAPTVSSVSSLTGTNSNSLTFDPNLFITETKNLSNPDPSGGTVSLDSFTGTDPNARPNVPGQWDVVGLDPFLYAGMTQEHNASGSTLPLATATSGPETSSPGYQQFGQSWLDLLNTIGSQNLQWGGRNDFAPDLKGGASVTPWDTTNITAPWNAGKKQDAYYNAVDFVSKNMGIDPNSEQAQKLGGAYLEYTLQNNNLYGANTSEHDSRNANDKGILGDILPIGEVIAQFIPGLDVVADAAALATAGYDFSQGNTLGGVTSALGGLGGGLGLIGDVGSTVADIGAGLQTAAGGIGVGEGIAAGNPLEAISGLAGLAAGGTKLYDGTVGDVNSPLSSQVTSSVADDLGIDPSDLSAGLGIAKGAGTIAGTAVPLVENALASPGNLDQLAAAAPLPPPPAAPTQPPASPDAGGSPLTAQTLDNPAQAEYERQQQLAQLLGQLGIS